jgi:hypothetical protein
MQKLEVHITCTLIGSATLVADRAATCNERHRSGRSDREGGGSMNDHAHPSNCPEHEGPCSEFWSSLTNEFNEQQDI